MAISRRRARTAFLKAGALVDIRPSEQTAKEQPAPAAETGSAAGLSLLPPNTGSLEDCAVPVAPAEIGDISGIHLAPAGADLDESLPPSPPEIDTTGLSLTPAGTGSLEACQQRKQSVVLPDISDMTLEENER